MSLLRSAVLLLVLALAGCRSGLQGTGDEQKEPYFLAAKKRMQERDIQGAIDYFEKAIDSNPRSASAHIELGILFEQQQNDWPSALYHYTRALQIRPDYASADVIKQHIEYCKRELAKSVVQLPSLESLQRKVDTLAAENQQLRQQLQAWQSYYAGRPVPGLSNQTVQAEATSRMTAPASSSTPRPAPSSAGAPPDTGTPRTEAAGRPGTTNSGRTHTVASGETIDKIARRYGVRASAVLSANPTVDPRRIRPGQTLAIPTATP